MAELWAWGSGIHGPDFGFPQDWLLGIRGPTDRAHFVFPIKLL